MLAQLLFSTGAVPLILLGGMHLYLTIKDISSPKAFAPRNRELLRQLQSECAGITDETTIWRSMLGFHITHSLAVILVGLSVLYLSIRYLPLLQNDPILLWVGPALAWVFVILSKAFWFSKPFYGSLVSALLLSAGAIAASL